MGQIGQNGTSGTKWYATRIRLTKKGCTLGLRFTNRDTYEASLTA